MTFKHRGRDGYRNRLSQSLVLASEEEDVDRIVGDPVFKQTHYAAVVRRCEEDGMP